MTPLGTFLRCLPCCSVALLGGCSLSPGEQAARVNGVKITQEEVELVREHTEEPADEVPARRRLLDGLIVKELLAQQFLRTARGSAAVSEQAVSVARRELLAQRYIAELVAAVPPPSAEQMRAFYHEHPHMFAERRAFSVRTLDIVLPAAREPELRERVRAAASLEALVAWVRREELGFAWSETLHRSDALSAESLAQLGAMRVNEVTVLPVPQGVRVIQLVGSRPDALDEEAAAPQIRELLWAQLRTGAINAEVERLARLAAISITDEAPADDSGTLVWLPGRGAAVSLDSNLNLFGKVTGGAPAGGPGK